MNKRKTLDCFMKSVLLLAVLLFFLEIPIYATIYASISGQVTDEDTGKGVPKVPVSILGRKRSHVFTDKDGKYFKNMLEPGQYTIIFHVLSPYCHSSSGGTIYIYPGQNMVLNSEFKVGGFISGKVFKSNGMEPFVGAKVRSIRYDISGGECETKADGSYFICCQCPADDYIITVDSKIPEVAYKVVTGINVEKSKETVVDNIVFNLSDPTGIEGYVTSSIDGLPINDVDITLWDMEKFIPDTDNNIDMARTSTDINGYFSIKNLPAGKYEIYAIPPFKKDQSEMENVLMIEEKSTGKENIIVIEGKKTRIDLKLDVSYPRNTDK